MTAQLGLDFAPPRDLVLELRALGVPASIPIVLHHNRRVMLSFKPRSGLRVHAGYARAPAEVVAAIAKWARPWVRRKDRREAARIFLSFSVHPDGPPRRVRRPDRPDPGDDQRIAQLQALHAVLNARWFDGRLAPIPIELSGRMRRKLGHYEPKSIGTPLIAISRRHLRRDGWASVSDTLLHEMVHQWQDELGLPVDHGPEFRRKAKAVAIEPRAITIR